MLLKRPSDAIIENILSIFENISSVGKDVTEDESNHTLIIVEERFGASIVTENGFPTLLDILKNSSNQNVKLLAAQTISNITLTAGDRVNRAFAKVS